MNSLRICSQISRTLVLNIESISVILVIIWTNHFVELNTTETDVLKELVLQDLNDRNELLVGRSKVTKRSKSSTPHVNQTNDTLKFECYVISLMNYFKIG